MKLFLQPAAVLDVEEAVAFYESRTPGLGDRFVGELERILAIVREHPRRFPCFHGEARKAWLRRFPFAVVYRVDEDFVVVLGCFHARRSPAKVRKRI